MPGVWLQRLIGRTKEDLASAEASIKPVSGLRPNFTVKIDSIAYGNHVRSQLLREGKDVPAIPEDIDAVGHDAINLTRMILVAMLLQRNCRFALANAHSFEVLSSGDYNTDNNTGIIPHSKEEVTPILQSFLPPRPTKNINRRLLSDTLVRIEQYYRPFIWEIDRFSIALSYLWSALIAHGSNQVFTNLAILIESLLSTRSTELTHLVSEHAATILGRSVKGKVDTYREVRSIYAQRSKIVHGKGVPKKGPGPINRNTFVVSSKLSIVPHETLKKALSISLDLLNSLIRDREYMSIVRSGSPEKKINLKLDDLFISRL